MAKAALRLDITNITNPSNANTYTFTVTLYLDHNDNYLSHNDSAPYWIWEGNYSTSDSNDKAGTCSFDCRDGTADNLGSITMTFTKGTSARTVTIYGECWTDTTDIGNVKVSKTVTIPAGNYTWYINYNTNGGSSIARQEVKTGELFTVGDNKTTTRTGYTFDSANSWLDPKGVRWPNGNRYTWNYTNGDWGITNNTLTLTANWTGNSYTVIYNANGGTGTTSSTSATYGTPFQLTNNGFTKTGTIDGTSVTYNFLGWSTDANASTPTYTNKQRVSNLTTGNSITLYAIWGLEAQKPSIQNAEFIRCDSQGNINNSGSYVKIKFDWTPGIIAGIFHTMAYTVTGSDYTITQTSLAGASGTIEGTQQLCEGSGTATLTLIDTATSNAFDDVVITLTIPMAIFPVSINKTGTNITLFGTANNEQEGLYIKDLNVGEWIKAPYLKEPNTAAGHTAFLIKNNNRKLGLFVQSDGSRGIWDYNYSKNSTVGKWLIEHREDNDATYLLCEGFTYPFRDHVIDRGETTRTSGGNTMNWTYERYVSGKAECWGYLTSRSIAITNAAGNGYRSASFTYYFPQYKNDSGTNTDLFNHYPIVTASAWNGATYSTLSTSINDLTSTTVSIIYTDFVSNTNSVQAYIHAIGTWRTYRPQL